MKYPKKKEENSNFNDMISEGKAKYAQGLQDLRDKRKPKITADKSTAKNEGGLFKGRYN